VWLWARLVLVDGVLGRDTVWLALLIAANASVLISGVLQESEARWRMRLLFYPVAMNLLYFLLGSAVPHIHPVLADPQLQAVDRWLFGGDAVLYLQRWTHPAATELLSLCYLWYLLYLFSSQIRYLVGDLGTLKAFYTGLFTIYAIGYLGYATLPALGPYLAMADRFSIPLTGGWLTHLTSQIVLAGSNRVDVFPSLHVANSVYILLFDYHHSPRRFRLSLLPCTGLIIATVYLRYHYLIDVLCGLGLSLLALWLSQRQWVRHNNPKEVANDDTLRQVRAYHRRV
jgi:membrane-associated phospholipid phosphatase